MQRCPTICLSCRYVEDEAAFRLRNSYAYRTIAVYGSSNLFKRSIYKEENMGFVFGGSILLFMAFFIIVTSITMGIAIFVVVKNMQEFKRNQNSPVKREAVIVVTKRQGVRAGGNSPAYTSYYVTFEDKEGKRSEFRVPAKEYGYLAEGDIGILEYQGTKYLHFEREDKIALQKGEEQEV